MNDVIVIWQGRSSGCALFLSRQACDGLQSAPQQKHFVSGSVHREEKNEFMKRNLLLILVLALCGLASGQFWKKDNKMAGARMMKGTDVQWGPAPNTLPPGAKLAVLEGDPSKPGPFTIRLKAPNGYKVMPHWHPSSEQITVLSGSFSVGTGDTWNDKTMTPMGPGSYMSMDAKNHHYATTKGETVIQVSSIGPFVVNYVNPNDDPSKKTAAATPAP